MCRNFYMRPGPILSPDVERHCWLQDPKLCFGGLARGHRHDSDAGELFRALTANFSRHSFRRFIKSNRSGLPSKSLRHFPLVDQTQAVTLAPAPLRRSRAITASKKAPVTR